MPGPPSAYVEGHATARPVDPDAADTYIAHTTIGDPELDPVMEELADLPPADMGRFIAAGIDRQAGILREAPGALRDFFEGIDGAPGWVDHESFKPGVRAFHANATSILDAFVAGTLIEGFATTISKSFFMTGRVMERGVRRLRQNNRHQVEIFYPEGLRRENDGWKLSVRIRFVHAQVRRLLASSGEWDEDVWGTPISAANLGYAIACFSARTLVHSTALGARYSREQREGYHAVWRYVGHLMGIPESVLYTTEEEARHMFRIGLLCEPDPADESVIMANALINSAPLVADITDPAERRALARDIIFPISRALVGKDLADSLHFPASTKLKCYRTLFLYRLDTRLRRSFPRLFKDGKTTMETVFNASLYDPGGHSYNLPDHVESELSSPW
ncbi:MAG: oxygenase MpaB family protein [Alphaproteobacteria bacterium]|nr:oxygenase MpaB family protein [Alphaproteobacteria bacterium]